MKLENQICTAEQAKKLKELGVEQNALFSWVERTKRIKKSGDKKDRQGSTKKYWTGAWTTPEIDLFFGMKKEGCFATTSEMGGIQCVDKFLNVYAAFTVAELLRMLPFIIRHDGNDYFMSFGHSSKGYRVIYETNKLGLIFNLDNDLDREKKALFGTMRSGKYAAEVLAEYLRMLIENGDGVVELSVINERLNNG